MNLMAQVEIVSAGADFARLLVQHDRAIFRYILTFVSRHGDAEEILQRVAMVLWEKFAEYDCTRDFLPWAFRVAYFEVLNFRKEAARNRHVFSEDVLEELAETREAQSPLLEAHQQALQECLAKLSPDSAALLRRRYCDSETVAALAAETGKTAKSLYRRLDRIRDLIAACVESRVSTIGVTPSTD